MKDIYLARVLSEKEDKQSVSAHCRAVSNLSKELCPMKGLTTLVMLAGLLHDAGKCSPACQDYFEKIAKGIPVRRGEANHSTAGGLLAKEICGMSRLTEVLSFMIFSHHGLLDCVNTESGRNFLERRQSREYQEEEEIELETVRERFYSHIGRAEVEEFYREAAQELDEEIIKPIVEFMKKRGKACYGSRDFYFGMYVRMLLSVLIDGDRIDAAQFDQGRQIYDLKEIQDRRPLWQKCIAFYEGYIEEKFSGKESGTSRIDKYRSEISRLCMEAGKRPDRLYRLTVPTGAGKTLSSLRFALYHAAEYGKQHIIYVAPFHSILDQNAEEIRDALGDGKIVLEHHCNVVHETEEEKRRYEELTENWLSPVIVTTAVQMLNTLFGGKTSSVRRMHSLCKSIIIFDEVQSLPVRTVELFNLAINFLTEFCNTTVVLCSATQPVFDELPQNRMMQPEDMIRDHDKYERVFRRTTLIDKTMLKPGGLSVEELGDFITERFYEEKQILVIVNTKACAENLYHYLRDEKITENLFHLSANMHVKNRQDKLRKMKELLNTKEEVRPVICVSTPIIEAGVDISFQCVIRSLTGLDSIIQAAGRCNRNAKSENGNVYIIKMSGKAEVLISLPDIRKAQEAMEWVLFYKSANSLDDELSSAQMKSQYYRQYFISQKNETNYPQTVNGASVSLVELLSGGDYLENRLDAYYGTGSIYRKYLLKQAFKTAGELFEVIPQDGKFEVVVEYGDYTASRIRELESEECTFERRRDLLRELQLVTVGISQGTRNSIGNGIYSVCNGLLFVLRENYYDSKTGVLKEPKLMSMLFS